MAKKPLENLPELDLQFKADSGELVKTGALIGGIEGPANGRFLCAELLFIKNILRRGRTHTELTETGIYVGAYAVRDYGSFTLNLPIPDADILQKAQHRVYTGPLGVTLIPVGNKMYLEATPQDAPDTFAEIVPLVAPEVLRPHASELLDFAGVLLEEVRKLG